MIPIGSVHSTRSSTSSGCIPRFGARLYASSVASMAPVAIRIPYHRISIVPMVKAIGPGDSIRFRPFFSFVSLHVILRFLFSHFHTDSVKNRKKQKKRFLASFVVEATPRFELGMRVLQTRALPLGYVAELARVAGFEPAHDGIRIHCLTTWLYPNNTILIFHSLYMGWVVGFEPTHTGATTLGLNRLTIPTIFWRPGTGSNRRPPA